MVIFSTCVFVNVPQMALVVQNLLDSAGDVRERGLILGSGASPGEGNGNPLQCFCLENLMARGDSGATVHGVSTVRHD